MSETNLLVVGLMGETVLRQGERLNWKKEKEQKASVHKRQKRLQKETIGKRRRRRLRQKRENTKAVEFEKKIPRIRAARKELEKMQPEA
jgi:hypothetical protein